jgi:hypothetical protein
MTEIQKSRLDELAQEINQEHQAFRRAFKATYRSALRAGDLLIEAKAEAGHGNWAAWVEENCEFSMRTAQVYMRLSSNREEVEELLKCAEAAHLSIEGALSVIASQRETPVVDVLAGEVSPYRAYPPDSRDVLEEAKLGKEPGAIEQMEKFAEGREALAELNNEDETEGARLYVRGKIADLGRAVHEIAPEEAAKREFADHAAEMTRDVVKGQRRQRKGRITHLSVHLEGARDARNWLGAYIQKLEEAEARLYERGEEE